MIKRIAINPAYGAFIIPSMFINTIDRKINYRAAIAKCIDALKEDITKNFITQYEELEMGNIQYVKHKNKLYFKDSNFDSSIIFQLEVVEVDTSKKWGISNHHGMESIVYYIEPKLIDKELNMYEW